MQVAPINAAAPLGLPDNGGPFRIDGDRVIGATPSNTPAQSNCTLRQALAAAHRLTGHRLRADAAD
jgi:hypothetical protein